ncbi:hypothetical protein pb186bvf_001455 [Paramecium bursaria]
MVFSMKYQWVHEKFSKQNLFHSSIQKYKSSLLIRLMVQNGWLSNSVSSRLKMLIKISMIRKNHDYMSNKIIMQYNTTIVYGLQSTQENIPFLLKNEMVGKFIIISVSTLQLHRPQNLQQLEQMIEQLKQVRLPKVAGEIR